MIQPHELADGRFECQNCLKKFTKTPGTYIKPKFCSDACRKEFHFSGGLSLRKLKALVSRLVRDEWAKIKEEMRAA